MRLTCRARLLALAFALALAAPARAADPFSLLLDWYVNPNHAPIIIAQEKGYFAAENLAVEVVAPADPSLPPRLVAAGQADLAISYQPQLHLQVEAGLPLRRVGTLIATPLNCLLVRDDGPVKTLADLKGRKIGYSVAGVEEALLTAMLRGVGLTLADVELINVNFALAPAVMSGQVDAVIGAYRTFELTQMRLNGVDGRCFAIEEHGSPTHDELIYVANADALKDAATRDKLRRFMSAVEAATAYILNHPEEAWTVFSATSETLQDALNAQAWVDTLPRLEASPAAFDHGRYRRFSAFLAEAGLINATQAPSAVGLDLNAE